MANEQDASDARISNWTLATGTKPGERDVYPTISQSTQRSSVPESPVVSNSLRG